MRIIPVIDLMAGQVVRGIAGRRSEYRPVESQLAPGSNPSDIAAPFRRLGLDTIYVADLDAIGSGQATVALDWISYRALFDVGVDLYIDAGLRDESTVRELAEFQHHDQNIAGVIVALETLSEPDMLARFVKLIGAERLIFSLDLREGKLTSSARAWQSMSPLECATTALAAGVRRFIVLDVAAVGILAGVPTLDLCRELRRIAPGVEIISGGGVRGLVDLEALAEAGCDAALVASALHDGRLTPNDIAAFHANCRKRPG